jgi:glycolate oxidase
MTIRDTSPMERGAELVARARLICGEQHVLTHHSVLVAYRSDGLRRNGGPLPLAVILPGSASEVVSIVSACADTGLRYVVRGAGTSRSGEALPRPGGVMIVLTRMRRIVSVDGEELTVDAGVPVASLPNPRAGTWLTGLPARGTVGGHVAELRGCADISLLELVRPDGKLLRLDASRPGFDVCGAFPGSRGHAGIAVTLTLRRMSA